MSTLVEILVAGTLSIAGAHIGWRLVTWIQGRKKP